MTSEGGRLRKALSKKELLRSGVLGRVKRGELRVTDAAVLMAVTYRDGKRLWARYQKHGAACKERGQF